MSCHLHGATNSNIQWKWNQNTQKCFCCCVWNLFIWLAWMVFRVWRALLNNINYNKNYVCLTLSVAETSVDCWLRDVNHSLEYGRFCGSSVYINVNSIASLCVHRTQCACVCVWVEGCEADEGVASTYGSPNTKFRNIVNNLFSVHHWYLLLI